MRVQVEVKGLLVDPVSNTPMVVLRGNEAAYVLPIWVGVFEANAIALQMERIDTPRPMTHDLLRTTIERLGYAVQEVVVADVREDTFYAVIALQRDGERVEVDARPSDAIALALRTGAPIFVDSQVLEKAQAFDPGSEDKDKLRSWFESLAQDDLGSYEM